MKKFLLTAIVVVLVPLYCGAQENILTLRECIEWGIENNLSIKGTEQDVVKAGIGKSESRSRLLPVIQGFGNFTNNVHPGTMMTDGSNLGALFGLDLPYMPSKSLRYSTIGGLQLSMPLYDQTLYTGISIAKKVEEISSYSYGKAKEDLTVEISKLYYMGQVTAEQIRLVHDNIHRLEELKNITKAFHDNGMVLNVDVSRVSINLENLQIQLNNLDAMYEQQLNMLRYVIDLSPEMEFDLEPIREDISSGEHLLAGVSPDLYELKLLDAQEELIQKQGKIINQGYIPSLSLVGQLSYSNFTDEFKNYFHSHPSNHWYNTTYWGLSLKVPIFDGFAKKNMARKNNTDYQKLRFTHEDVKNKLDMQYRNSLNEWQVNRRNLRKQIDNYRLAEEVYAVTTDQYKEGVASMTELLQDELRMNEAQINYTTALYNYMSTELGLLKLTGQLDLLTR